MIASKRRDEILRMVQTNGSVSTADIAKELSVSIETVRKDLLALSNAGLLIKRFGGAQAIGDLPFEDRSSINSVAKNRIAMRAIQMIQNGNIIFIDSGSTTLCLAKQFQDLPNVSVLTNSFKAVEPLAAVLTNLFFMGGQVDANAMDTTGLWFSQTLATIQIDIAFLGTNGFHSHSGPCSLTFADASAKTEVVKNAKKSVVLADGSKFTSNSIIQYASWKEIDTLITDESAPADIIDIISKDTTVIVV